MSATIPSVAVPGLKNVLLEDDDFALVYCAACRKDALDVRTGKLHKDDLCIVDCCQAVLCAKCFCGPHGAPDEVQQCVICRARTPRFVVLSLNLPSGLAHYFKPVYKQAVSLASAASYQHAATANHLAFLKRTCFNQRDKLNKAKIEIDQLQNELRVAKERITQLENYAASAKQGNNNSGSSFEGSVPSVRGVPSFASVSRPSKRKQTEEPLLPPRAGLSTKQRLGLDTPQRLSSLQEAGHSTSHVYRPLSRQSNPKLHQHVQQFTYDPANASTPSETSAKGFQGGMSPPAAASAEKDFLPPPIAISANIRQLPSGSAASRRPGTATSSTRPSVFHPQVSRTPVVRPASRLQRHQLQPPVWAASAVGSAAGTPLGKQQSFQSASRSQGDASVSEFSEKRTPTRGAFQPDAGVVDNRPTPARKFVYREP